jgi:hypothetical protein
MRLLSKSVLVLSPLLFMASPASAQMCADPYYGYIPCWQLNQIYNRSMYNAPVYNQPIAPSSPNPSADWNPYGSTSGYGVLPAGGYAGGGSRGGCYSYVRGSCEATR